MTDPVRARFEQAVLRGDRAALVTVVAGPGTGQQLLVWASGDSYGDLGHPRLNQRVALFVEQMLERAPGAASFRKAFELPSGEAVEVEVSPAHLA